MASRGGIGAATAALLKQQQQKKAQEEDRAVNQKKKTTTTTTTTPKTTATTTPKTTTITPKTTTTTTPQPSNQAKVQAQKQGDIPSTSKTGSGSTGSGSSGSTGGSSSKSSTGSSSRSTGSSSKTSSASTPSNQTKVQASKMGDLPTSTKSSISGINQLLANAKPSSKTTLLPSKNVVNYMSTPTPSGRDTVQAKKAGDIPSDTGKKGIEDLTHRLTQIAKDTNNRIPYKLDYTGKKKKSSDEDSTKSDNVLTQLNDMKNQLLDDWKNRLANQDLTNQNNGTTPYVPTTPAPTSTPEVPTSSDTEMPDWLKVAIDRDKMKESLGPQSSGYTDYLYSFLPQGYNYNYQNRLGEYSQALDNAEADWRSNLGAWANTLTDTLSNNRLNMLNALRENRASGWTSGAHASADAGGLAQAAGTTAQAANEPMNTLTQEQLKYLATLASKRSDLPGTVASELLGWGNSAAQASAQERGYSMYGREAADINAAIQEMIQNWTASVYPEYLDILRAQTR